MSVAILEREQPKMDWIGPGYKWHCVPCGTGGTSWMSMPEVIAAGKQHAKIKHNGVPDWLN